MGHFERHLRELGERDRRLVPGASRRLRRLGGGACRPSSRPGRPGGHLALPERRRPVVQARADRRRRPRARGPRARLRPRPADAVRRQPRPPRPAHRRRARVRRPTSCGASTPGRCSSTTRREEVEIRAVRAARGRAARPGAPGADDRRQPGLGAVDARRRAPLQGAPASPRPDDGLLDGPHPGGPARPRPRGPGRLSRAQARAALRRRDPRGRGRRPGLPRAAGDPLAPTSRAASPTSRPRRGSRRTRSLNGDRRARAVSDLSHRAPSPARSAISRNRATWATSARRFASLPPPAPPPCSRPLRDSWQPGRDPRRRRPPVRAPRLSATSPHHRPQRGDR